MQLNISGHHMNNGRSLEEYVAEKVQKNVNKYLKNAVNANVTFMKDNCGFKSLVTINKGEKKYQYIKGEAQGENAYRSFNLAMEKVQKQLRRYKRKVVNKYM